VCAVLCRAASEALFAEAQLVCPTVKVPPAVGAPGDAAAVEPQQYERFEEAPHTAFGSSAATGASAADPAAATRDGSDSAVCVPVDATDAAAKFTPRTPRRHMGVAQSPSPTSSLLQSPSPSPLQSPCGSPLRNVSPLPGAGVATCTTAAAHMKSITSSGDALFVSTQAGLRRASLATTPHMAELDLDLLFSGGASTRGASPVVVDGLGAAVSVQLAFAAGSLFCLSFHASSPSTAGDGVDSDGDAVPVLSELDRTTLLPLRFLPSTCGPLVHLASLPAWRPNGASAVPLPRFFSDGRHLYLACCAVADPAQAVGTVTVDVFDATAAAVPRLRSLVMGSAAYSGCPVPWLTRMPDAQAPHSHTAVANAVSVDARSCAFMPVVNVANCHAQRVVAADGVLESVYVHARDATSLYVRVWRRAAGATLAVDAEPVPLVLAQQCLLQCLPGPQLLHVPGAVSVRAGDIVGIGSATEFAPLYIASAVAAVAPADVTGLLAAEAARGPSMLSGEPVAVGSVMRFMRVSSCGAAAALQFGFSVRASSPSTLSKVRVVVVAVIVVVISATVHWCRHCRRSDVCVLSGVGLWCHDPSHKRRAVVRVWHRSV
jgi:hypothetical protein